MQVERTLAFPDTMDVTSHLPPFDSFQVARSGGEGWEI